MNQVEVFQFLESFFRETNCEIVDCPSCDLHVKLTVEIDKLLMNRPFYWHYLEATGSEPKLSELSFLFEKSNSNVEPCINTTQDYLHFGTPRLHKIFDIAKKLGSHIRQFEITRGELYPWIGMNFLVSYECNVQKSKFISIGLNLLNGLIIEDFSEKLKYINLSPKITDMSYTLHPAFFYKSGIVRIKKYVSEQILLEDFAWAGEAITKSEKSIGLLNQFYDEHNNDNYLREKNAIIELFNPRIIVNTISGGMFYLKSPRL